MQCTKGFKNVTVNISNGLFFFERCSLPLENDGALHLKKLESLSPEDALRQVWLKLTQWFWRKI